MKFEISIARRLFGLRDEEKRLSRPAVTIAMWGVAVGLAVMILSVCIVLGFKGEVRNKVVGFGGHIQLINYQSLYSAEPLPIAIDTATLRTLWEFAPVRHSQRFATRTGMLKTDEAFMGIVLRGVAEEYDTTFLHAHLVEGHLPHFMADSTSNDVLLSMLMARTLGLNVGDRVYAYFFSDNVKARRFRVVGLYQTHMREFDEKVVFTGLRTVQQLAGWERDQCTGAELLLDDFSQLDEATAEVATVMNRTQDAYGATYSAHSIRELYPAVFGWLDLLDTNVYVILALMMGLSLFTMTAGLLIIILERTNFIAVMKSLGTTNGQLRRIFLCFAMLLVGKGVVIGNLLGIGLAWVQHEFGVVHLDPATYYVDAVPISLPWGLILLINIGTLLITTLVLVLPSYLVSRIEPARVMRFE